MSNNNQAIKTRVLLAGSARYSDLIDILSKDRNLLEQDVAHTGILALDQGRWASSANLPWDATAITVADRPDEKRRLVVVGEDGQTFTYMKPTPHNGTIAKENVMIRRANNIDGYAYACGMHRKVFKRIDLDNWLALHAPTPQKGEVTGFECIDGFNENEVYCAGWNGEIWYFNGVDWLDNSGLTSLILTSCCCAEDQNVYIVGQHGTLICGRKDQWQLIELEDDFTDDLWDVHWFAGKLYLTTMTGLYTLDGAKLEEVIFDDVQNGTFYRLSSKEGVLWSIGSANLLSFDGKTWTRHL